MASGLPLNTSSVFGGLGTATFTVVTAGLYTCGFKSTIPYVTGTSDTSASAATSSAASALSVVVNQDTGGGPVAKLTVSAPAPTQPMMAGKVTMSCSVGDVITVVTSSSAAADAAPNAVKTTINLYQGE